MKVGEPSADGRGSAPPELAEQQARAGSEAAPEGRKALSHRCTDGVAVCKYFCVTFSPESNIEVVFSGNL